MCDFGTCDECLRSVEILKGNNGLDGTNGKSVISATGAPSSLLGVDGDFYVDKNAPFNFYSKSGSSWTLLGRLQGLDGNGFFITETTLITSAQLLASLVSPVVVTQTPPVGYTIIPVSIAASLRYNSIPYQAQGGMSVVYNDTNHTLVGAWATSFIGASQSVIGVGQVSPQLLGVTNKPLAIKPNYPYNITVGNSDVLLTIIYYIAQA